MNEHPNNIQHYGDIRCPSREKLDEVTLIFDVVLPVFHEVLQRYQRIFYQWHHIFRRPGLHSNQHDPRVQLFLVDLGTEKDRQTIALLVGHSERCVQRGMNQDEICTS